MSNEPDREHGDTPESEIDKQQPAAEERYRKIFEYNNDN